MRHVSAGSGGWTAGDELGRPGICCWIVAYRAWGYAGLQMQYAVRRRKGFRHMSLSLSRLCTYQKFCCFHTLCRLAGYWFYGLCFVEFGSMDHGGSWKCLEC